MRVFFLILIGFTSFVDAGNFSRSNGVVSDGTTNLEWQDNYSDNSNFIKNTGWQSAINYCESLTLDGKSDWRLPNLNELTSLIDDTKYNPSINEVFQNTNSSYYWSSTSFSGYGRSALVINFSSGNHYYTNGEFDDGKFSDYSVRCVRDGQ